MSCFSPLAYRHKDTSSICRYLHCYNFFHNKLNLKVRKKKSYSECLNAEQLKTHWMGIQISDIYLGLKTKCKSFKRSLCTSPVLIRTFCIQISDNCLNIEQPKTVRYSDIYSKMKRRNPDFGQTQLVWEQFLFESNFVRKPNDFVRISDIQTIDLTWLKKTLLS